MRRDVALRVLHDIHNIQSKMAAISAVSLDMQVPQKPDSYALKLKCALNESSRNLIKPIVEKYNLAMKELNGFVIITSKT